MVTGNIEKKIRNFHLKIHLKISLKFALLSWVCVCVGGGGFVLYFCWMLGGFDLPLKIPSAQPTGIRCLKLTDML